MNKEKILRGSIFFGLSLLFLTPFIVASNLPFPFITGKAYYFRLIVEIVFALWLALALVNPIYRPVKSKILYIFTGLVVLMFFANLFGANPERSFWSNYERMDGYMNLVHIYALFIVLNGVFNNFSQWTKFIATSAVTSIGVVLYGLLQLAGKKVIHQGGVRLDATFGNATYLAVYCMIQAFFAGYILYKNWSNKKVAAFFGVIGILNLFIMIMTATRGVVLGLFIAFIIAFILVFVRYRKNKVVRNFSIGIMLLAAISGGIFWLSKDTKFVQENEVLERFANISLKEGTVASRLILWGMASKGIVERPLLGWGQENFTFIFDKHYDVAMHNQEQWFDRSHNAILDWFIHGGIFAGILYLLLFVFAFYYLWKKSNFDFVSKLIFSSLLTAYLVQLIFVFDNLVSYIMFVIILSIITTSSESSRLLENKDLIKNEKNILEIVTVISLVVFLFIFYIGQVPGYKAGDYTISGRYLFNRTTDGELIQYYPDGLKTNINYFEKALALDTFGDSEIRQNLFEVTESVARQEIFSAEDRQNLVNLAVAQGYTHLNEYPGDTRFKVIFSVFLARFGQLEESARLMEEALQASPNKVLIYASLAQIYAGAGDYEKAIDVASYGRDLQPESYQMWQAYAQILGTYNVEEFDAEINRVVNSDKKRWVVYLAEENVRKSPDNPQSHFSYAASWAKIGNYDEALRLLEDIKEKFPQYNQQTDQFIEQVKAEKEAALNSETVNN